MGESGNENLADSAGKTPGSERNLRIFEVNAGNSRWTDPDLYSFQDQVALICHEEGKLLRLPLNRSLRNDCDQIYDAIAGMFFLRRIPIDCDSLESLT